MEKEPLFWLGLCVLKCIVIVQSDFSARYRFCCPPCGVTSREHWDQQASACAAVFCFVRMCFRYRLTVESCMQRQTVK